jgi:hypothetical protein
MSEITKEQIKESNNEISWAQKLSSDIFKHGVLINVTISKWEAKLTQTEEDQQVLGVDIDNTIYTPGFKYLIPGKTMAKFSVYRTRLSQILDRSCYRVPGLKGSRFVPRDFYPNLKNFLEAEKERFNKDVESFKDEYPILKDSQINKFNEKYPEYSGYMDQFYPSANQIVRKFNYSWTIYSWAQTEITEIAMDAKNDLAEKAAQLVYQAGMQIREHIVKATQDVVSVIQNGRKNSRGQNIRIHSITNFTKRLNELKQINLFNDPDVEKTINNACEAVSRVSNWNKNDSDALDLETSLTRIVDGLKKEVEEIQENPERMTVIRKAIEDSETDDSDSEVGISSIKRNIYISNDDIE